MARAPRLSDYPLAMLNLAPIRPEYEGELYLNIANLSVVRVDNDGICLWGAGLPTDGMRIPWDAMLMNERGSVIDANDFAAALGRAMGSVVNRHCRLSAQRASEEVAS